MAILIAFLIFVLVIFSFRRHFLLRGRQLPPGPNRFRVLAYLPQFIYKPHVALQNLSKIYGPIMSVPLGGQLLVVASSPAMAKEFCKSHDRALCGRHLPIVYHRIPGTVDSSIVMSPDCGTAWKLLRGVAQSSVFSSRAMERNARIRQAKVADLVGHVRAQVGRAVDVEDLMFATLVIIISSVITSRDLLDIEEQTREGYEVMMGWVNRLIERAVTYGTVDYLPALKWVDFWSKGRARDLHRGIKHMWGGVITERRLSGRGNSGSEKDYLGAILEDPTFSDDQVGTALTEMMIAATDSTKITTVWLMVELLRNPKKLSRVRVELAQTVQGSGLSETLLSECSYFQACIKGTLRLHVPAPLLVPHCALETCQVSGYIIPRGSMVVVNSWAIARDPESWQDPTTFMPERFLDSKIGHLGTHFEYLPFGSGLRTCPGAAVALRNIQMMVGSLLHYFDWSMPDGSDPTNLDVREKYMTTLKRKEPLLLVPKIRSIRLLDSN